MTDVWQNRWEVERPWSGRRVVSCFHCSRTIDWERRYNEQLEWIAVPTLLTGGEGEACSDSACSGVSTPPPNAFI